MEIKKLWAAIVGYGNRGQIYGDYSLVKGDEFGVAAVIDPKEYKLKEAKERYNLNDDQVFYSFDDFVKSGMKVDFVINTTMDQLHYEIAIKVLQNGYNMLMEKPIVAEKEKLLEIRDLAKKNNCNVFVCHVLRYTPFYLTIKKLLLDGEIGRIVTIEMNEHVGNIHYLTSYDRGKWNSKKICGSSFLLAKCCHDLDLICWLNNVSRPTRVASFGHRAKYVKENKPEGSSDFCYDCKIEENCPYSAMKLYYERDAMPFLVWDGINKPMKEITKEDKLAFLKKDDYGRCAFNIEKADIMDRQNLIVDFENGSCASFTLSAGSCRADRYIHIVGEIGEIEGKIEGKKITVRKYDLNQVYVEREIDIAELIKVTVDPVLGGHSGGDFGIMYDIVRYLNGDRSSISITSIDDSVNGHLCVYAADESMETGKIVDVE